MLLSIAAVALLGVVALGGQPAAIAQDATPAADESMQEGVTYEPVTFALGVGLASPADPFVARIGIDPGMGFPILAADPSSGMCRVEAGTITIQAETPVSVTRGATLGEGIPAGEAGMLEVGDAAYIPGSINGEIRNDGDEPAVCLAFVAGPSMGMMAEATPEP